MYNLALIIWLIAKHLALLLTLLLGLLEWNAWAMGHGGRPDERKRACAGCRKAGKGQFPAAARLAGAKQMEDTPRKRWSCWD